MRHKFLILSLAFCLLTAPVVFTQAKDGSEKQSGSNHMITVEEAYLNSIECFRAQSMSEFLFKDFYRYFAFTKARYLELFRIFFR